MTISSLLYTGADSKLVREFKRKHSKHSLSWIDGLTAAGCAGGLTLSTLYQVHVRTSAFAVSDFKTLYASAWCFAHKLDAYRIANLQHVFGSNAVVQPAAWYGHSPVYPWTTLSLLMPFTALPMVPAAFVATILIGVLLAGAVAALMYYGAKHFSMDVGWRVVMGALCGSGPLLGFAMNMGNVSAAACALCILAFVFRESASEGLSRARAWGPSLALALALLLKPHLAVWCGLGMLLLPERAGRKIVMRSIALTVAFTALTATVLVASGQFGMQTRSYIATLSAENSGGASMSSASREALPVVSQVISLQSVLGFWIANPIVRGVWTGLLLLAVGVLLARWTRQVDSQRSALLAVGAWCSLGMLATYHRAHDASLLILLVPWVVARLRRAPLSWRVWMTLGLYCAMSISADFPTVVKWLSALSADSALRFVLLRQAGLAELLLLGVLLFSLKLELPETRVVAPEAGYTREVRRAA